MRRHRQRLAGHLLVWWRSASRVRARRHDPVFAGGVAEELVGIDLVGVSILGSASNVINNRDSIGCLVLPEGTGGREALGAIARAPSPADPGMSRLPGLEARSARNYTSTPGLWRSGPLDVRNLGGAPGVFRPEAVRRQMHLVEGETGITSTGHQAGPGGGTKVCSRRGQPGGRNS